MLEYPNENFVPFFIMGYEFVKIVFNFKVASHNTFPVPVIIRFWVDEFISDCDVQK